MSSSLLVFVVAFIGDDEPLAIRGSRRKANTFVELECEMHPQVIPEDYTIKPYFLEIIKVDRLEYQLVEAYDERSNPDFSSVPSSRYFA